MMMYFQRLLGGFILTFLSVGLAIAADAGLTVKEANQFIDSLPALEAQSKSFENRHAKTFDFKTKTSNVDYKNVYKNAVAGLKVESPADYAKLKQTIAPFNLTPTRWAEVGDRLMAAYIAINMTQEAPNLNAAIQGLDMSQLEQLPPEMRAQIEASLAQTQSMFSNMQTAPEGDIAVVKTVRPRLEAAMEASGDD